MSGVEPIAIAALVGGTALSATSQVMQGRAQAEAGAFEQAQLEQQKKQLEARAETERIAAAQAETKRRTELTDSLETIQAIRAGRNVGGASPTGMAIFDSITERARTDIGTERFNFAERTDATRQAAETSGIQATMAGSKARTSLLAGYLGAGATVGSAAFSAYNVGAYGRSVRRT